MSKGAAKSRKVETLEERQERIALLRREERKLVQRRDELLNELEQELRIQQYFEQAQKPSKQPQKRNLATTF